MVYRRGDVCYANLGDTLGSEQGGIRPVVILQNDIGNRVSPTTVIAPLTSQCKKQHQATHVLIPRGTLPKDSMVMLEQIRTIDKQRILSIVGSLDEAEMKKINDSLKISLGL